MRPTGGPLVVVGDVLLDRDVIGHASRLCPDGTGAVVETERERRRVGGAGLAALLAARDGREVVLVAPVADDEAGREIIETLETELTVVRLPAIGTTPEKFRVRSDGHTVVRVDRGGPCRPTGDVPHAARRALDGASVVLVSDYGGRTTMLPAIRSQLRDIAGRVNVVWDPHRRGGAPIARTRLVTPNVDEVDALTDDLALDLATDRRDDDVIGRARALVRAWGVHGVAVTLGGDGAALVLDDGVPLRVPASVDVVGDTCGAGDRFASAVAGALQDGAILSDAVRAGVHAATAYVLCGGPATLEGPPDPMPTHGGALETIERTRAVGGRVVATGGCFDIVHAGHVSLLQEARRLGDCLVVLINSDASVRRLKGEGRPVVTQDDRVEVLRALGAVDAVEVFDEDTPVEALRRLQPDVWVKGGDYAMADLAEVPVIESWGGRTVLVPYLDGRSTSRILESAATG